MVSQTEIELIMYLNFIIMMSQYDHDMKYVGVLLFFKALMKLY